MESQVTPLTAAASRIITETLEESVQVARAVQEREIPLIANLVAVLVRAFRSNRKIVLFGNGGSAADAQHVAAELVNRFQMDRDALPAIALTTDTSILTAIGNDAGYEQVFARQVRALVQPGDVAVGFSTSGNSSNVLNGVLAAREKGGVTIGFTGRSGGQLKNLVDHCLCAPSDSTPRIQEAHIAIWHAICAAVEQELFGC